MYILGISLPRLVNDIHASQRASDAFDPFSVHSPRTEPRSIALVLWLVVALCVSLYLTLTTLLGIWDGSMTVVIAEISHTVLS